MVKILRIGLLGVIIATVVPYGAVHPHWFYLAALLNGIVFAGTLVVPIRNKELLKVHRATLTTIVLLSAYLLSQSVNLNALANPIWADVQDLLNTRTRAISVDPSGTIAAMPLLIHPFLIFAAALVLHQSSDAAVGLWRRLALIGGGIAVFGVLQHILFPQTLLWGAKLHYLDSVTGTFVNRNSAATFFGIAALVLVGTLVHRFRQFYLLPNDPEQALHDNRRQEQMVLLRYLGLFLAALLALFLTKSRGGVASTLVPFVFLAVWSGYSILPSAASRSVRLAAAALAATLLISLFFILGAKPLFRIEQGGIDDSRWCVFESTVAAINDNFWFGTGFGTFKQVFPIYRQPECGIAGVWERAHNVFLEGYLGMGLPFAVVVAFILLFLLRVFRVGYHSRRRFRVIPLVGAGTLLLVVLHGMVDFSVQIPGVAAYVAAVLGAAVAVSLSRTHAASS